MDNLTKYPLPFAKIPPFVRDLRSEIQDFGNFGVRAAFGGPKYHSFRAIFIDFRSKIRVESLEFFKIFCLRRKNGPNL